MLDMLPQIAVIAGLVIGLLAGLAWYGRHANLKTPLMKDSCHGCCADCALDCKDRKNRP